MKQQSSLLGSVVGGSRVVLSVVVFAAATFVFVGSLTPHGPTEARTGGQPPRRATLVSTRPQVRSHIYYYVVAGEEQVKQMMDERAAAIDYYGAGYPNRPPVIVVARTQETYEALVFMLDQTAMAGGPSYTLIDLR